MKFEKEFRKAFPETVGEKDYTFDLSNYADFLESLVEAKILQSGEAPVQQLKAAIALVRKHANMLHEAGAYSLNSFLDVIEQRAAV